MAQLTDKECEKILKALEPIFKDYEPLNDERLSNGRLQISSAYFRKRAHDLVVQKSSSDPVYRRWSANLHYSDLMKQWNNIMDITKVAFGVRRLYLLSEEELQQADAFAMNLIDIFFNKIDEKGSQ